MENIERCLACNKDILSEDIFMRIDMDMHRLAYDQHKKEKNFIVPDGPVKMTAKFYLCESCSQGLMESALKNIAIALVESKDRTCK